VAVKADLATRIECSADAVFDALAAVETYPSWLIASGVVAVERFDSGPIGRGSKLRLRQSIGGRSTVLEGEVTSFDPPGAFGLRARDRDGVKIAIDALVDGEAGGARLRWSIGLTLPLRFRMFEGLLAPQVQRAATLDLEALRRRLEGSVKPG
jgi:hypothetical protein